MSNTESHKATSKRDTTAAARHAKAQAALARRAAIALKVQEILSDPTVNPELKRKLSFAQERAERTHTDKFIKKVRDDLLKEAQRRPGKQ